VNLGETISDKYVFKYNYIIVCRKARWASLICHTNTAIATNYQTPSGQIS